MCQYKLKFTVTCVNSNGLLQVVGDVSEELIEEEEDEQNNSDFNVQSGIFQVLQDKLQQDRRTNELEDHGEDDQEEANDEPHSGEPPDCSGQGGRLGSVSLLLPQSLQSLRVTARLVLVAELQDVGGGQAALHRTNSQWM